MKKFKYFFMLLKIYFSYLRGKKHVNYFPLKVWIETSGLCNLACRLCANKELDPTEKKNMDFELFKKIIDEIKTKVFEVNLFHRGEPLINPKIIEMTNYAAKSGIKTRLHTNAVLLNPEISEALIKSGLHEISFSFDGYTKEMFEKNRIGANFEDTLFKINEFLKLKKSLLSKTPYTTIQIIEYDEDKSEELLKKQKKEFFLKFKNNRPNRFALRRPHNWGGALSINSAENTHKKPKEIKTARCTFPWYVLVILSDGTVLPCPQDFFGKLKIGSVFKKSIKEIFNEKPLVSLRAKFAHRDIDDLSPCSDCDKVLRKTFLKVPLDYMGIFFKDSIRKN